MIIYEVNLSIDERIYSEYLSWLNNHAKQMLRFPGFIQASIFKEEQAEVLEQPRLTVQYHLESRRDLERYFTEFASKMREEGLQRFGDKFSATRRIFEAQVVIIK